MRSAMRTCLAEGFFGCATLPFVLPFLACDLEPLACATCNFIVAAERRKPLDDEDLLLLTAAADLRRSRFSFAERANALTSWSLRIECHPERPLCFAKSARSFQVCVFRDAVVIKRRFLRWDRCTDANRTHPMARLFFDESAELRLHSHQPTQINQGLASALATP